GLPGCPETSTSTGNRARGEDRYAGGRYNHAARAENPETLPGMGTALTTPPAGIPGGGRQTSASACPAPAATGPPGAGGIRAKSTAFGGAIPSTVRTVGYWP